MGKFLILWSLNPTAPFPTDPEELLQFYEKVWAAIDDLIKKGEITEMGAFMDGISGYVIGEGESVTIFKNLNMFTPFWTFEVYEAIPLETAKEIWRATTKARIEAAKK